MTAPALHPGGGARTNGAPVLVLQKYGGSSVADLDRIRACARRCLGVAEQGHQLVVIVSAMAGETNRLIALANALVEPAPAAESGLESGPPATAHKGPYVASVRRSEAHDRELDQLVATGEKVSAALLAIAINDLAPRERFEESDHRACPPEGGELAPRERLDESDHQTKAVSLVGHQLGMRTDRNYTRARITHIDHDRIRRELTKGHIVVCAGFQGIDEVGDITTLGRGGSDTSAVAFAAAMQADVCEILTDVDGVYTTDPRLCGNARKIDRISYEEMLELAALGAKVLQSRSVELAMKHRVPVHVRSSLHEGPGTFIVPEEPGMEDVVVSAVALDRNEAKITLTRVPDVPGTVAALFERLGSAGIVVDMIIQNAAHDGFTDVTFTVPEGELSRARALLQGLELPAGVRPAAILADPGICKVSVVGVGMRSHAGVAAKTFGLLAAEGINVQMVSTSEIKISVVVDERYGELALRCLHDGFGLGGTEPPGSPP
ncbi:aspartate kinase [Paraliomyxa miuraensis]|uniref:aspartate kinase n=1 Tax=Paraliomyxa miuraensis TaxID=376150 RepID=UPI002254FA3A|nr:aspartate kinase [Paraliomyxa miuraensis]MCX4242336.1 aspartate kinase [Paraliomyxa miuraensis]